MTSVPKPLKFLRPHYETLRAALEGMAHGAPNREALADVVSAQLGPAAAPACMTARLATGAERARVRDVSLAPSAGGC